MPDISSPLKWHGGKYYLADKIISIMPPHITYVEPCFGGGQVLFRKNPEGVSEIVNDIDGDLMNFWQVLADPLSYDAMECQLLMTPFSQRVFEQSLIDVERGPVARAISFFIKYRQSRQALGKDFATMSRRRTRRGMNEQVSSWLGAVEGLPEAHERLRRVVIFNEDVIDLLVKLDGPETLFYIDCPYLHETRTTTKAYDHEMTAEQHQTMLGLLGVIKGNFILSGYRSQMYDEMSERKGWPRIDIDIDNKSSSAKVKEIKTECLWTNFKPETS